MTSRTVQLRIEIVDDDETGMCGTIGRGREPAEEFTGWLGLITGIDRLISDPGPPAGGAQRVPNPGRGRDTSR